MRKGIKKLLTVALTATLGLAALAGCGTGTSSNGDGSANGGTAKELSGKIQLAGSTSMEKMCGALMEAFMEEYPNVTVTTEYTGSGAGIESVTSGAVDIGNASRALSDKEKSAGIEENIVAIDGIAMITDKNNKVTNVTKQQLTDIYTGKITNWKDLGGSDEAIVVIGRDIVNSNTSQWCFHIESTVSSTGDGIARHSVIVGQCTVRSDSQQQTVRSGLAISGGIKYGGFYIIFIGCTGNIKYEIVEKAALRFRQQGRGTFKN